jgi:hypothetical protein
MKYRMSGNASVNKWGEQYHANEFWLGIVMEELGEAAKETIEGAGYSQHTPYDDRLRAELIQVAAVVVAWIECIDWRLHTEGYYDVYEPDGDAYCDNCGRGLESDAYDVCDDCARVLSDYHYINDYDEFDEWDEWEEALSECGMMDVDGEWYCSQGGTEYCDFDCPIGRMYESGEWDDEEE